MMNKRRGFIAVVLMFSLLMGNIPTLYANEQSNPVSISEKTSIEVIDDEDVKDDNVIEGEENPDGSGTGEIEETLDFYTDLINETAANVYYIPEHELPDEIMAHELDYLARFMGRPSEDIRYYDIVYDANDMPTYLVVEFSSSGYAVMLRTIAHVMEHAYSGHSPYHDYLEEKKLYAGAFSYLLEVEGDISDLDGALLSDEAVESLQERQLMINEESFEMVQEAFAEMDTQSNVQGFSAFSGLQPLDVSLPIWESDPSRIPDYETLLNLPFGNNIGTVDRPNGSCGPLASSMLLNFYDEIIDEDFVSPQDKPTNMNTDRLHQVMLGNTGITKLLNNIGTVASDDRDGINTYLSHDLVTASLGYYAKSNILATEDFIVDKLDEGMPVMIYTMTYVEPIELKTHVSLAFGYKNSYEFILNGVNLNLISQTSINVHSGRHSYCNHRNEPYLTTESHKHTDDLYISVLFNTYGGAVWLEECPNHNLSNVILDAGEPDTCYKLECPDCGIYKAGAHDLVLNTTHPSGIHYPLCNECGYSVIEPEITYAGYAIYETLKGLAVSGMIYTGIDEVIARANADAVTNDWVKQIINDNATLASNKLLFSWVEGTGVLNPAWKNTETILFPSGGEDNKSKKSYKVNKAGILSSLGIAVLSGTTINHYLEQIIYIGEMQIWQDAVQDIAVNIGEDAIETLAEFFLKASTDPAVSPKLSELLAPEVIENIGTWTGEYEVNASGDIIINGSAAETFYFGDGGINSTTGVVTYTFKDITYGKINAGTRVYAEILDKYPVSVNKELIQLGAMVFYSTDINTWIRSLASFRYERRYVTYNSNGKQKYDYGVTKGTGLKCVGINGGYSFNIPVFSQDTGINYFRNGDESGLLNKKIELEPKPEKKKLASNMLTPLLPLTTDSPYGYIRLPQLIANAVNAKTAGKIAFDVAINNNPANEPAALDAYKQAYSDALKDLVANTKIVALPILNP